MTPVRELMFRLSDGCHPSGALEIADQSALYIADSPTIQESIEFVFGDLARVSSSPAYVPARDAPTQWLVQFAAATPKARQKIEGALIKAQHRVQVKRWKGDHSATRFDFGLNSSIIQHERPFRGYTLFDAADRSIAYLWDDAPSLPHVEHLLKYPIRVGLRGAGYSEVHAATVSYAGRGIALMGYRKSGKTTLGMHMLTAGGRMVGSDLALIRPNGEELQMVAVPHMTRIAPPTIADNAALSSRMNFVRSENGDYMSGSVFCDGKEEIYYPVLRRLFGREIGLPASPTSMVVMPQFDPACARPEIRVLRRDEAREVLCDRLVHDPPLPEWLPFHTTEDIQLERRKNSEEFVRRLPPVYGLRFGTSSSNPMEAIEKLIEKVH